MVVFKLTPELLIAITVVVLTPFLLAFAWVSQGYVKVLKMRKHLPPGPFPLPLFGNHFIIPKSKPWIAFFDWSKYYNDPLLTVWIGHRPFIYCNDATSAIVRLICNT